LFKKYSGNYSYQITNKQANKNSLIFVLKGNSPDSGQTVFSLEHLEICLKEAEEKARALLEQVIPTMGTGKICC
jgi:hypothetical protein